MNILNRLISPSLTKCTAYLALASGFGYFETSHLTKGLGDLESARQEIVASTPNLARVRDLDYHFRKFAWSGEDTVNTQLRAEKENLLNNPETNEGYVLYKKLESKSNLMMGLGFLEASGAALFGILGGVSGFNYARDRIGRRRTK